MRRWTGITGMMTLLAFLVSGAAIGQTKSVSESTTKEKGDQGSVKTKTKTVIKITNMTKIKIVTRTGKHDA